MTRDELLAYHDALATKARAIMTRKNEDYTGGTADPFANFRTSEAVLGIRAEMGILMRTLDKIQRLRSFMANGTLAVKEESVEDALLDVINYMILFGGMVKAALPEESPR